MRACWCAELVPIPSRTRVVLLQHPRERRVKVGTGRMAWLALANAELHVGVSFERDPRLAALLAGADAALLYPDAAVLDPAALPGGPPRTLIVIDGTWDQARKMLARNPALAALPRLGIAPTSAGRYRIRREPAPHCLATVEALARILGRLEGAPERFQPMLAAFERMVERQLAHARTSPRPWFHAHRRRRTSRAPALGTRLAALGSRLVLVHAEADAAGQGGSLLHLLAVRVGTGGRFAAVVAPAHPLAVRTPHDLELPEATLLAGEPARAALARFAAFVRSGDVLGAWGTRALHGLLAAGLRADAALDLRAEVNRELGRRSGGVERAAALLDTVPLPAWAPGRAGRRLAALAAVVDRLAAGEPRALAEPARP
jgi:DTW domain-containing protein YfiP